FESFLVAYPNSEWVNLALKKLGLIYVNLGQPAKGLEYFKRVFANNPEPSIAKDALNGIEEIYIALGDPDGYVAFLESVPGYQVSNAQKDSINFRVAEAFYAEGDYLSATRSYTDYLRKYPNGNNYLLAHFRRGESYWALKDYPNSINDYDFLLERIPNRYAEASARKSALVHYNINKDFAKAYTSYIKFTELASSPEKLHEAQLGALRSAYRAGLEDPTYALGDAIVKDPKTDQGEQAEAQYYIAKMALEKQKYDRSRAAFNQVIALTDDERSAEARYSIAFIYYLQRDLATAKELALNTNSQIGGYEYWLAKSVLLLADIFVEEGDTFNARAALESIVENYDGDQELLDEAKTKLARLNAQTESENNLKFREDNSSDSELQLDAPIDNQ
ncbi:MAG: tetratricopeptide repeat protein, partial [Bacteroidota bacterium]